MKHALTYGLYLALAGAFLILALYFGGLHDDAEKMKLGQTIGMIGGLAISIVVMLMGGSRKAKSHSHRSKMGLWFRLWNRVSNRIVRLPDRRCFQLRVFLSHQHRLQ